MVRLSKALGSTIVEEHGTTEMLRRLSDPLWFQSFSCLIGFDWHSSGVTTTTMGALKTALTPEQQGIQVCGGKGRTSRETPTEILDSSLDANKQRVERASKMTAKVDNNCIQDGFTLYHHCIVFDDKDWCVVQQGMDGQWARRYHWFSQEPLTEHPVACDREALTLDLVSKQSRETRQLSVELLNDNPVHLQGQTTLTEYSKDFSPRYRMPARHAVEIHPATMSALKRAYQLSPTSYEELVALKGVGASSLRALALSAELVYGAKPSWKDPVKYSFAHGGKDGFPFPVDCKTYDETIQFFEDTVDQAKLGNQDKKKVLETLAGLSVS
jgi:hypothetical protein